MLRINDLHTRIADEEIEILKGIDLEVKPGELHAIMGPNGSGKSTLAKVVAGHPDYEVTSGEVLYEIDMREKNLLELDADERALAGVFLGFQYPVEIPGVSNATLLRSAFNAICRHQGVEELDPYDFEQLLREKMEMLGVPEEFIDRGVNVGYSGGEKKRNEILQLAVLRPRLALLDEIDSGLDIDALRTVADGINKLRGDDNAFVLITHYQRILSFLEPDHVHVLYQGRLVRSGGKELALEVEERGYDWLKVAS